MGRYEASVTGITIMSFLDRQSTIAAPGYSRWLVPPAALAVHLSIGQVYAFSVFKITLTQTIGITQSAPGDWDQPFFRVVGLGPNHERAAVQIQHNRTPTVRALG